VATEGKFLSQIIISTFYFETNLRGSGITESQSSFSFHTINVLQEEHDGRTDFYCDVVDYQNLDIIHRLYYENILTTGESVTKYSAGANSIQNYQISSS
jgi:hypothetical protein